MFVCLNNNIKNINDNGIHGLETLSYVREYEQRDAMKIRFAAVIQENSNLNERSFVHSNAALVIYGSP